MQDNNPSSFEAGSSPIRHALLLKFPPRQLEVMRLIATEGLSAEEIASRLPKKHGKKGEHLEGKCISVSTVRNYIREIEGKLEIFGLHGQVGITLYCMKLGMVTPAEVLPWFGLAAAGPVAPLNERSGYPFNGTPHDLYPDTE